MISSVNARLMGDLLNRAAGFREESYDETKRRYRIDCTQAAQLACKNMGIDPEFARLAGLALDGWWNDALDWADKQRAA
jgi:hypothetical protein